MIDRRKRAMTQYLPLIFLWLVIIFVLFQNKKSRRRRRKKTKHERNPHMNELIQHFIGKRCEIHGDLSIATIATVTAVEEDWLLAEDEKGKKTLINITYISEIREMPQKEKKKKE